MKREQDAQEATLEQLAHLFSGIASRGAEVQGALQRSTSADDIVRRTTDFLRRHQASLEAALGEPKACALMNLMEALLEARLKTRTEAQESLNQLLWLARQGEGLLVELLRSSPVEGETSRRGERSPQTPQGGIPP